MRIVRSISLAVISRHFCNRPIDAGGSDGLFCGLESRICFLFVLWFDHMISLLVCASLSLLALASTMVLLFIDDVFLAGRILCCKAFARSVDLVHPGSWSR